MRPKTVRTRRTTYVGDAKISYTSSYSEDNEESSFETWSRQLKGVVERLPLPTWSLMRLALLQVVVCVWEGWRGYASSPSKIKRTGYTNNIANFRGTGHRIGNKAKQRTKQAKAAALQAPKTSSRSHLLTNARKEVSVRICAKSRKSRSKERQVA